MRQRTAALPRRSAAFGDPGRPVLRADRLLLVITAAALGLLVILPIGRLALAAVLGPDAWQAATGRTVLLALRNSLESGVASSLLATLIGTTAALATGLTDARGGRRFGFVFVLSMMIAPQVAALGYITAFGPSSSLLQTLGLAPPPGTPHPLRGPGGIIAVLALHHAPLAYVTVRAGLARIPRELADAAAVDGAGRSAVLLRVLLPLLRGHLAAGLLLCFVAAVGNFGVPALLGAGANYPTLPTLIYRRLTGFGPGVIADMAAMSAWLLVLTGVGLALARRLLGGPAAALEDGRPLAGLWPLGRGRITVEAGLAALLVVSFAIPVLALTAAALAPTYGVPLTSATVTLDNFVEVLVRQPATIRALGNSALFSGAAAVLCCALALPCAYALTRVAPRWRAPAEALFEWPYAIPGIVLAVALILLFLRPLPIVGISLYGTAAIIILAFAARFLPIAYANSSSAIRAVHPEMEEAARILGSGRLHAIAMITAPLVRKSLLGGWLIVFIVASRELSAAIFLVGPRTRTMSVLLYDLSEAGNFEVLAAFGGLLLLVTMVFVGIGMKLAGRDFMLRRT